MIFNKTIQKIYLQETQINDKIYKLLSVVNSLNMYTCSMNYL